MKINKDTLIFGSFAETAGNNGCILFNNAFKHYQLNAIYKSFSVTSIKDAIQAARTLNFSGFAITMPYKKDALKYIDDISEEVVNIGALNTVVNKNGILKGYNTDYLAAKTVLSTYNLNKSLYILGNGGYAASVVYAAHMLNFNYRVITRRNWDHISQIENSIIYNCTPVSNIEIPKSNDFIDCLVTTKTGKLLSLIQASHQFKLYTNLNFPYHEKIIDTLP